MSSKRKIESAATIEDLVEKLRDAAAYTHKESLSHPIKHDPTGIDHPLWPIVSFVARDHVPGLFAALNPLSSILSIKGKRHKELPKHLIDTQMSVLAGVMHLTSALQLQEGQFQPNPETDMGLSEVVFNFLNRPIFSPLVVTASDAKSHPSLWYSFVTSTRMDGFLDNVIAYDHTTRGMTVSDLPTRSTLKSADPEEFTYKSKELFNSEHLATFDGLDSFCTNWVKNKDAEKRRIKRQEKGVTPRVNKYRDLILDQWLTDALWCRTTGAIASRYDSILGVTDSDEHERACDRLNMEMSSLGLSNYRHSEHDELIDKVVTKSMADLKNR